MRVSVADQDHHPNRYCSNSSTDFSDQTEYQFKSKFTIPYRPYSFCHCHVNILRLSLVGHLHCYNWTIYFQFQTPYLHYQIATKNTNMISITMATLRLPSTIHPTTIQFSKLLFPKGYPSPTSPTNVVDQTFQTH